MARITPPQNGTYLLGFPSVGGGGVGTVSAGAANRIYYGLTREGGTISKIGLHIGTSSGNLMVAVYRGTGSGLGRKPGDLVQSSGSVASPGTGYREITLGASVDVAAGDYLAVEFDNTTITSIMVNGGVTGNQIGAPFSFHQDPGSFTMPATATPGVGQGQFFRLVGVA